ncbi:nuclear transport factor 2 family protein [Accumulibacter sp.]|uniref:nuclear transport factor 2 family protein n=1 Tax=Accumulibacter sp. TaxID=2053492 RepID=UPI0025D4B581|nr:nuclear transport factor 2 family protein [Accumulibacter sp.]MCM8594184.1 nuclear transport factor 2 family protein [Accumulibacter sp.]MCM8625746.1 nuclear transport factor 2 family protein [Accumulibacter sp.]MDS4048327.1 nuclear transport factor 2 family protein [Accumulibacter sp.]
MDNRRAVDALVDFYENLRPETVAGIDDHYAVDAVFKDPFNEVCGRPAIRRVFAHLFTQVGEPRFVVVDRVVDERGALLIWEMYYRSSTKTPRNPTEVIRGASHLRFDAEGRVTWHRDYWDAAEELYARLPVIGWLMRALRRALAAPERA